MTTDENPKRKRKFGLPQFILILGLAMLLFVEGRFGYRLSQLSDEQEQLKVDYATVNDITLGLFSIQQWQGKITGIIKRQTGNLKLTRNENKQLQAEVEEVILALINKAQALIDQPAKSLGGKIKRFAVKKFVDFDTIRAQVPGFAKTMMAKINDPANTKKLTSMAMSKYAAVEHTPYMDSSIRAYDSITSPVFNKYKVSSVAGLNDKVTTSLNGIKTSTYNYSAGMLACIIAVLALWWIFRKRVDLHAALFIMSLLFAFTLLAVGLSAAMIEVDARIPSVDFTLLGEHVVFKDQVLFFQSKSILDVVHVLIKQADLQTRLVGVLILVFSILFPVIKLSSTGIHLLAKKKLAESKFVMYFAFQSGKWSMADVIVIGILMAYIGLNGLLQNQLQNLHVQSDSLTIIATNNTALQPGYIIFISYVLFGLVLSTILKFITPHDKVEQESITQPVQ